jgi:hypothetical protein
MSPNVTMGEGGSKKYHVLFELTRSTIMFVTLPSSKSQPTYRTETLLKSAESRNLYNSGIWRLIETQRGNYRKWVRKNVRWPRLRL